MSSPTPQDVRSDLAAVVGDAVARDFPGRQFGPIVKCASLPSAVIVRVYLAVPKLRPAPYVIYRVELRGKMASQLRGDDAAPYRIANYK